MEHPTQDNFKKINHKPYGEEIRTLAEHAINCITLCTEVSWKEAYQLLVRQSQSLGLMPDDMQCVRRMLETLGFVRQGNGRGMTVDSLPAYMEQHFSGDGIALLHFGPGGYQNGRMIAAVPVSMDPVRYQCQGVESLVYDSKALWIGSRKNLDSTLAQFRMRQQETEQRQQMQQRQQKQTTERSEDWRKSEEELRPACDKDHEYYRYYQPNPMQRNIGDCVIRAFSAVFGISWEESMIRLGDAIGYGDSTVNGNLLFINLLIKEGFERHKTIRQDHRQLTGKQFCQRMNEIYRDGERIFAFVGSSHVAAVLPYEGGDGKVHYRITDSWDSTERKIAEYWVKKPEPSKPVSSGSDDSGSDGQEALRGKEIGVGSGVMHPRFGKGVILSVTEKGNDRILEIDFGAVGVKRLAKTWVEQNCKSAGV